MAGQKGLLHVQAESWLFNLLHRNQHRSSGKVKKQQHVPNDKTSGRNLEVVYLVKSSKQWS